MKKTIIFMIILSLVPFASAADNSSLQANSFMDAGVPIGRWTVQLQEDSEVNNYNYIFNGNFNEDTLTLTLTGLKLTFIIGLAFVLIFLFALWRLGTR